MIFDLWFVNDLWVRNIQLWMVGRCWVKTHFIVRPEEVESEDSDQLRWQSKEPWRRQEDGQHTDIAAMVATWNATALGERDLWSEFSRMISGMSAMVVGERRGLEYYDK